MAQNVCYAVPALTTPAVTLWQESVSVHQGTQGTTALQASVCVCVYVLCAAGFRDVSCASAIKVR